MRFSKRKLPKDITQLNHFRNRFYERTGHVCSKKIINQIRTGIKLRRLIKIGEQSNRVSIYDFKYQDNKYILLYDEYRCNPITLLFLSKEFLQENNITYIKEKVND